MNKRYRYYHLTRQLCTFVVDFQLFHIEIERKVGGLLGMAPF